jgi:hypothetical protein
MKLATLRLHGVRVGRVRRQVLEPTPKKPLMASRVALLGEEEIPRELLDSIDDAHMQVFLREPDPNDWPEALRALEAFLPAGERLGSVVTTVVDRHQAVLEQAFEPVLRDVCQSVSELSADWRQDADRVVDEMLKPIRILLSDTIGRILGS